MLLFWGIQFLLSYIMQTVLYADGIPENLKWMYPFGDKFSVNISDKAREWIGIGFSYGFMYLVLIPFLLYLWNKGQPHKLKTYFQKPRMTKSKWFEWASMCYTIAFIVNIVGVTVFSAISQAVSSGGGEELNTLEILPSYSDNWALTAYFITVAILAPVFEELLLRGTVLTHTLQYGQWFSFIVVGVSFGLLHGNFQQMFYATAIGIMTCFITYKAKSIIPAIFTHLLINTPSAVMGILLTKMDFQKLLDITNSASEQGTTMTEEQSQEYFSNIGAWAAENSNALTLLFLIGTTLFVVGIIGFFNLFKKLKYYRDEFICGNACASLTTKQKILAYISTPVTIIFILLMLVMAVLYAAVGI